MSAPLVVNTRDGVCWTRRTVTSSGIALYAPEKVKTCPEFVMATLAELAEHGIAGSADVLPMPVGPELSERDRLRAAYIEALDEAHQTHPCPQTGRPYWMACVHYDENRRVAGVGSCYSERRADAVLAVRDAEMESLRARVAELEQVIAEAPASYALMERVRIEADGITQPIAPSQVLREVPDGEHYRYVHHENRIPHDLPETGGERSC